MVRIACGAITLCISTFGVMPSAWPARSWLCVDTDDSGPQDLGDERGLVQRQRQARGGDRRELDPDMRQRVVGEDKLQDERRAAEDDRVGACDRREGPEAAQLHRRQDQPHREPARQPKPRDDQREVDAFEQIRQAEVVEEQVHRRAISRR